MHLPKLVKYVCYDRDGTQVYVEAAADWQAPGDSREQSTALGRVSHTPPLVHGHGLDHPGHTRAVAAGHGAHTLYHVRAAPVRR